MQLDQLQDEAYSHLSNLRSLLKQNLKGENEDNDPQLNYLLNAIYEVEKNINGIEKTDLLISTESEKQN